MLWVSRRRRFYLKPQSVSLQLQVGRESEIAMVSANLP
jgi:hypothetical protein